MLVFYFLVLLQFFLLAAWLRIAAVDLSLGAASFSPAAWVGLFFLLGFGFPQLYVPIAGYEFFWKNNSLAWIHVEEVYKAQIGLLVFLGGIITGSFFLLRDRPRSRALLPLADVEHQLGLFFGAIGLVAVVALLFRLDPYAPRSTLVADLSGKLLYALSFLFTIGLLVLVADEISKKRYWAVIVLLVFFSGSLLLLGGRGRALWPVAGVIAWLLMTRKVRLPLRPLILGVIVLAVVLQLLDPLILYIRGRIPLDLMLQYFWEDLSLEGFFYSRNFANFHDFALVMIEDQIPHHWAHLFAGVQAEYMGFYHPLVAARGVGFPATLPGGLWISGGWLGLFLGGGLFGLFIGWLHRRYLRIYSEFEAIIYCVAMPYLANIGTSYLDSYSKFAALVVPGAVAVWLFRPRVLSEVSRVSKPSYM